MVYLGMPSDNLLVFDIETSPMGAEDQKGFPHPLFHQVVAIAFLRAKIIPNGQTELYEIVEARAAGDEDYNENKLVTSFFRHVEQYKPRLVTFNGRGFDVPVLKYRGMIHEISAPEFYSNNYMYRYDTKNHCDVLDVLTDFGASPRVKLDDLCSSLGFPGKLGTDGSMVRGLYKSGKISEIRNYCEYDVFNTFLVYVRLMHHFGNLDKKGYEKTLDNFREYLTSEISTRPHLRKFCDSFTS